MPFEVLIDKHAKYFNRMLGVLPSLYEKEDSNKLAILYFAINSLSILNKLDVIKPTERQQLIDQIYDNHLLPSGEGFRGSKIYKISTSDHEYDPLNLASTFFALNILYMLKDESITTRLDRYKIMQQVQRCQLPTGEFCPILDSNGEPFGDRDLRYCMIAATIRLFLQLDEDDSNIDLTNLENFILKDVAYDGGLGGAQYQESHSGLTFCGLSTLKLIKKLDKHNWDKTIDYLVHRQIGNFNDQELEYDFNDEDDFGGFNGRLNKYGDTCYAFWGLGSLKMITDTQLIDEDALIQFLSRTQHPLMGGFNKTTDPDDRPDPLHSFLGLVCCSMLNLDNRLKKFNLEYMLDEEVVQFIKLLKWN